MGLSCIVSEIDGDFSRKSQIFPTPVYFAPQPKGFPWNLVTALGVKTLEWWPMGLPGRERCLTISSAVWIQCTNVMDKRTTDTGRQQRPRYCIASRSKNNVNFRTRTIIPRYDRGRVRFAGGGGWGVQPSQWFFWPPSLRRFALLGGRF